jgi:cullin-4
MVQRLLDFKALADTTVSTSFVDEKVNTQCRPSAPASNKRPNSDFVHALSDAFTTGFKARRSTPAEMIAMYLDIRQCGMAKQGRATRSSKRSLIRCWRFIDSQMTRMCLGVSTTVRWRRGCYSRTVLLMISKRRC